MARLPSTPPSQIFAEPSVDSDRAAAIVWKLVRRAGRDRRRTVSRQPERRERGRVVGRQTCAPAGSRPRRRRTRRARRDIGRGTASTSGSSGLAAAAWFSSATLRSICRCADSRSRGRSGILCPPGRPLANARTSSASDLSSDSLARHSRSLRFHSADARFGSTVIAVSKASIASFCLALLLQQQPFVVERPGRARADRASRCPRRRRCSRARAASRPFLVDATAAVAAVRRSPARRVCRPRDSRQARRCAGGRAGSGGTGDVARRRQPGSASSVAHTCCTLPCAGVPCEALNALAPQQVDAVLARATSPRSRSPTLDSVVGRPSPHMKP